MTRWVGVLGELFVGMGLFLLLISFEIPPPARAPLVVITGGLLILVYYVGRKGHETLAEFLTVICAALILVAILSPMFMY